MQYFIEGCSRELQEPHQGGQGPVLAGSREDEDGIHNVREVSGVDVLVGFLISLLFPFTQDTLSQSRCHHYLGQSLMLREMVSGFSHSML
jgi:hypothetical protein